MVGHFLLIILKKHLSPHTDSIKKTTDPMKQKPVDVPPKSAIIHLVPATVADNLFPAPFKFSMGKCWQYIEAASGSKDICRLSDGIPA